MKREELTKTELMSMVQGFRKSDIIIAGVELGIFDVLAKKALSAEDTASAMKADERGTEILLNALTGIGLLKKTGGKFGLTDVAKKHLTSGGAGSMVNSVRHSANLRERWLKLPECVMTGKPALRGVGGFVEAKHRDFILAMHDGARGNADLLASKLGLENVRSVLDVGGGPGTYLFAMISANPEIRGAIVDLRETLKITQELIRKEGLRHAVGTMEADFNQDDFGDGYDIVLMSSIIHINSPEQNKKLVKKGAAALNPGGRLVVSEFMLDDTMTQPEESAIFSVNMLVNTPCGRSYSESEIKSWMKAAGLEKISTFDMPPRSTVMVGVKPDKKKKVIKKKAT